jgi:hypothetical protein
VQGQNPFLGSAYEAAVFVADTALRCGERNPITVASKSEGIAKSQKFTNCVKGRFHPVFFESFKIRLWYSVW